MVITNTMDFTCEICENRFPTNASLYSHKLTHGTPRNDFEDHETECFKIKVLEKENNPEENLGKLSDEKLSYNDSSSSNVQTSRKVLKSSESTKIQKIDGYYRRKRKSKKDQIMLHKNDSYLENGIQKVEDQMQNKYNKSSEITKDKYPKELLKENKEKTKLLNNQIKVQVKAGINDKKGHEKTNKIDHDIRKIKNEYNKKIKLLNDQIEEIDNGGANLSSLNDAIFNDNVIKDVIVIQKLIKNNQLILVTKKHVQTLFKIFLGLYYGVIPICQPQRDNVTDLQRKLVEKFISLTSISAKKLFIQRHNEFMKLFSIIDSSLDFIRDSFIKYGK